MSALNPRIGARIQQCYSEFERHEMRARDGTRLVTYERGPADASPVVLVNPIGVPLIIVSRLAERLAENHRVISWEQRGFGASAAEFFANPHDYSSYVTDVLDVIAQRAHAAAALVGVCSGASLVIKAIVGGHIQPASVALVSPAIFFSTGCVPSAFDTSVVPFMRMIDGTDRQLAGDLFDLRMSSIRDRDPEFIDDSVIVEAADTVCGASVESLLVYSRIVKTFTDQRLDAEIAAVGQLIHLFAAVDDSTVSIQSTRRLRGLLPEAVLHEYAGGGHFCVFTRSDLQTDVVSVVDSTARQERYCALPAVG